MRSSFLPLALCAAAVTAGDSAAPVTAMRRAQNESQSQSGCSDPPRNCRRWDDDCKCKKCKDDYHWDGDECKDCRDPVPFCRRWDRGDCKCRKCDDDYFWNDDKYECKKCYDPHCRRWGDDCECDRCDRGYEWDGKECKKEGKCEPIDYCRYYYYDNFFFKCKKCRDGYYPKDNGKFCKECFLDHCERNSSDGYNCKCKKCEEGYYRTWTRKCKRCFFRNCESYSSDGYKCKCDRCKDGWFWNGRKCSQNQNFQK